MATRTSIRATALASLIAVSSLVPWQASIAGDVPASLPSVQSLQIAASDASSHSVALGVSKSLVIDLPRDIRDVLVADPTIANVVVRSSRRAYIIGIKQGQTSVFIFDAQGKQIASLDLAVMRDLNGIRSALKHVLPNDDITVEGIGDAVVLSGTVASQLESQQAYDMASRLVEAMTTTGTIAAGSADRVVNALVVRGRDQIMLKVTVAEVERDVIKQLGVNLTGSLGYGAAVVNFNNFNPFSALGESLSGSSINRQLQVGHRHVAGHGTGRRHSHAGRAEPDRDLRRNSDLHGRRRVSGLERLLLLRDVDHAGCADDMSAVDRIQEIRRRPELHAGRARRGPHQPQGDDRGVGSVDPECDNGRRARRARSATVPSIRTRRADTTVEIPSGGTLAMAGMIQDDTKHQINGLPGLAELPVLGALFRSNDYINQRTELVVLVTPYVVRAVAQKDLSKPDDGFADPSDPAQVLLGHLNRIYGVGGGGGSPGEPDGYHGRYGFILD